MTYELESLRGDDGTISCIIDFNISDVGLYAYVPGEVQTGVDMKRAWRPLYDEIVYEEDVPEGWTLVGTLGEEPLPEGWGRLEVDFSGVPDLED